MPMIDVYAAAGTFRDTHTLAREWPMRPRLSIHLDKCG